MVVTSPIGDHAPPALAARITIPANNQRSFLSTNFLSKAAITMEVVKLSKTAEKKKVNILNIQSNLTRFVVVILSVMTAKPSCASMSSTIVIAPNKKKSISAISTK